MIVLGLDTATPATAVALHRGGEILQAREDPPAGARPGHTAQVLALSHRLLDDAGLRFRDVELVAVGLGPGTFTGLRIGVATARALAQALNAQIAGVSSLRALAVPALAQAPPARITGLSSPPALAAPALAAAGSAGIITILDARRGEAFMAAYEPARTPGDPPVQRAAPRALPPERLPEAIAALPDAAAGRWLAVGDGALLFASQLEAAGVQVAPADSPLHRVQAGSICELALTAGEPQRFGDVLPHYGRRPDAELAAGRLAQAASR